MDIDQKINEIISALSLEEKAGFCVGRDFWHTKALERLGIPSFMFSDGPFGLRKQIKNADHLGLSDSVPAICFPSGSTMGASFDREVAYETGKELGKLTYAEEVGTSLGPAINMKRSPLCGRNFEYYSEDPKLASGLAASFVKGLQSQNVGACPKHFFGNNQEYRRLTSNSVISDRAIREIYLAAFEDVIKDGKPWFVMSSYNRVNGKYVGENKKYLTDVLRGEWGFEGCVVSDWGAVNDPVASVEAGLDIEMPGPAQDNVNSIVRAVRDGSLSEAVLDRNLKRIFSTIFRYQNTALSNDADTSYDYEAGHEMARKASENCAVLLKNEDAVLPLKEDEKVVLIGEFVKTPRYQGGGSSHVHSYRVTSAWDVLGGLPGVSFAQGYRTEEASEQEKQRMLQEAVAAASDAQKAVIFAGLPDDYESEGFDRDNLALPDDMNRLIEEVAKVQPDTIVVLHNGSPVTMPWVNQVKGLLEMYLGGEAVGEAAAEILYGKVNPSGRLAETFPLRLEDTPAYPSYGREKDDVHYREDIFVGYRHYSTRRIPVLFPFGYGLSYTTFQYSNLVLDKKNLTDADTIKVSVDVTNTGTMAGKEVVQLYVSTNHRNIVTPVRELRAFDKISLEPGERRTVQFALGKRAFAYWDEEEQDWEVPTDDYRIEIAESAESVILSDFVHIETTSRKKAVFTRNSTIGDIMADAGARAVFTALMAQKQQAGASGGEDRKERDKDNSSIMNKKALQATTDATPLRSMITYDASATYAQIDRLIEKLNEAAL